MDPDIQAVITQASLNENAEEAAAGAFAQFAAIWEAAIAAATSLSPADRTTLQATATAMKASAADLGAAIVANTPPAAAPPAAG